MITYELALTVCIVAVLALILHQVLETKGNNYV